MIFKNLFHTSTNDFDNFELSEDSFGYIFLSKIPITVAQKPKYIYICDVKSNNPLIVYCGQDYVAKLRELMDEEGSEESLKNTAKTTHIPIDILEWIKNNDEDYEYEWQDFPSIVEQIAPQYDCVVMQDIFEEVLCDKKTDDYCVFNPNNIIIKNKILASQYKPMNESKKKCKKIYITEEQYKKIVNKDIF